MNNISVPADEILKAKEKFFNESVAISENHKGNAFMQVNELYNLVESIYTTAYQSGYRQSELENIINN